MDVVLVLSISLISANIHLFLRLALTVRVVCVLLYMSRSLLVRLGMVIYILYMIVFMCMYIGCLSVSTGVDTLRTFFEDLLHPDT